jgi:hypothetical protein
MPLFDKGVLCLQLDRQLCSEPEKQEYCGNLPMFGQACKA